MANKELYINGVLADIDENTRVDLSYKSPLFSDLQTVTADATYTVKLPKTAHNLGLIEHVNIAGAGGGFPYDYFRADYIEGGFPLIREGTGYLLTVAESIEVSILFGGVSGFAKLKDAKLNEMPIPIDEGLIVWDEAAGFPYGYGSGQIRFVDIDFGVDRDIRYTHPCVGVPQIFDWIRRAYDFQIETIGEELMVPCVTKNRREGYSDFSQEITGSFGLTAIVPEAEYILAKMGDVSGDVLKIPTNGSLIQNEHFESLSTGLFTVSIVAMVSDSANGMMYKGEIKNLKVTEFIAGSGTNYIPTGVVQELSPNEEGGFQINIQQGKIYRFAYSYQYQFAGKYRRGTTFNFTSAGYLIFGERFDTLYNLPNMKVTDFIKAIMQIEGVFPRLENGTIRFVSVDDIYANIDRARDWSDKCLEVSGVSFRFGDYVQNNTFSWKEDETVSAEAATGSSLVVENRTLEAEKKAVELPFAASDTVGDNYRARIPLYAKVYDKDTGELKEITYKEAAPRILRWMGVVKPPMTRTTVVPIPTGQFPPSLRLNGPNGIVARKYGKYQEVIRKPRTIKASFLLNPVDLVDVDLTVPVYVEQLNGYFAVMSLTKKEGVSEAELLKL